jgi:hypothetical protein
MKRCWIELRSSSSLSARFFAVDECVAGEQPFWLDAVGCVEGEPALDKGGDRNGAFVAVELAVGEPRVVIDEGVHPLIADTHPLLGAGDVAVARDGMTWPAETDEAFRVDVKQVTRAGPLIAAWLLTQLAGRPRDPCTT